ncbi:MAG: helix-turn-helix transcriptional regulator [Hamadaea sp.]|nr:helix-turn-helix transcriptional regulator [Hamadaea sp.]
MGETVNRRAYNSTLREERAKATRRRIAEAARRLFVARSYTAVTMGEIAAEAGVAYQTVYAVFGTKPAVAREIIWTSFEVEGIRELLDTATASPDPQVWLRAAARTARLINERLGDLLRFLRESGDPELLAEFTKVEDRRREQERFLIGLLEDGGWLTAALSSSEALDVLWAVTGSDLHRQLVSQRHWTHDRYEQWLAATLAQTLLAGG